MTPVPRFGIGDRVWLAAYSTVDVQATCPICFGKLFVTLILGDDSKVRLPCDYCGKGYEFPRGHITERHARPLALERTIDSVTVSADRVEYGSACSTMPADNVHATEAEALAAAEEIAAKEQADRERSVEWGKHDAKKTFSWNAGYHMREAKALRAKAERHEERAVLCKERSERTI